MIRRRRPSRCRRGASSGRPARSAALDAGLVPAGAAMGATTPDVAYDTIPYDEPRHWPLELRSSRLPLAVRFGADQDQRAKRVLELVEYAWDAHLRLGFRAPPLIPDRRVYDIWLWLGIDEVSVAAYDEVSATAWNDAYTYMVVDPDGMYGGDELGHTLVHEVNHVFQGSDDWNEFASAYEGSATFVEWLERGFNDRLREVIADFQSRPHWSLDRDDGSETWYTYGFAMYLRYVQHAYAGDDPGFLGAAWEAARNQPGADEDPTLNEADLIDAFETVVPGLEYAPSVAGFARWRWYTGNRDDGRHDQDAASLPPVPATIARISAGSPTRVEFDPAPMILGTVYVELDGAGSATDAVWVSIESAPDPAVETIVQAVPGIDGSADGERVQCSRERARVRLGPDRRRTLIVTVVPASGQVYDPETRMDQSYPLTVVIARAD